MNPLEAILARSFREGGSLSPLREAMNQYDVLLQKSGGDMGEAFNQSEVLRGQGGSGVLLNRIAQSADIPVTAALAAPYEAAKGVEQSTGAPVLTGLASILNRGGVPVATPNAKTSPASLLNVLASGYGAYRGLRGR